MATEASARMAEVVAALAGDLKAAGFRKRRHVFNRTAEPGLVHVVDLGMAPFEPPGTPEIPGFRENLYGRFTVDVGVFAAAMHIDAYPPPRWLNPADTQLTQRIGFLLPERADVWWALDHPDAAETARRAILDHGLPWLDRFPTAEAVVAEFREHGPVALGMQPRGPLQIVALLVASGDRAEAADVLRAYLQQPLNPRHRPVAEDFARRHGLGELLDAG